MDPAVVGNDLRHGEDPGVSRLGQDVAAGPGERPGRCHQPVVHPVHPADQAPGSGQVELRGGSAGEHAVFGGRRDERADGVGGQAYVGVEVDPRKRPAHRVAEADGVHLSGHWGLDHAYAHPCGRRGGPVGTGVRHHDDVELAGGRVAEEGAQVLLDHGRLVVGRDHDADHRFSHVPRILAAPARRGGSPPSATRQFPRSEHSR